MKLLKWLWQFFRRRGSKKKPVKKSKPSKINLLEVLLKKVQLLDTFQRRPNTMARVTVVHEGQTFGAFGFSKVCHPDKWDECKGIELAMRDALIYLIQHYHLRPGKVPKALSAIYRIENTLH